MKGYSRVSPGMYQGGRGRVRQMNPQRPQGGMSPQPQQPRPAPQPGMAPPAQMPGMGGGQQWGQMPQQMPGGFNPRDRMQMPQGSMPFKPPMGQVDPGFQFDPSQIQNIPGTLGQQGGGQSPQGNPQAQQYQQSLNDMLGRMYGGAKPATPQGILSPPPAMPQRSQTKSPGIGMDGRRINYGGR